MKSYYILILFLCTANFFIKSVNDAKYKDPNYYSIMNSFYAHKFSALVLCSPDSYANITYNDKLFYTPTDHEALYVSIVDSNYRINEDAYCITTYNNIPQEKFVISYIFNNASEQFVKNVIQRSCFLWGHLIENPPDQQHLLIKKAQ